MTEIHIVVTGDNFISAQDLYVLPNHFLFAETEPAQLLRLLDELLECSTLRCFENGNAIF